MSTNKKSCPEKKKEKRKKVIINNPNAWFFSNNYIVPHVIEKRYRFFFLYVDTFSTHRIYTQSN